MDIETFIINLYKGFLNREPELGAIDYWISKYNNGANCVDISSEFLESAEFREIQTRNDLLFVPPGHFYSPIVDTVAINGKITGNLSTPELDGIDLNISNQLKTWELLRSGLKRVPFTNSKSSKYRYSFDNNSFCTGDSSIYYAMLWAYRPKKIIEIGSGNSSACALDFIETVSPSTNISFIEPFPELLISLLKDEDLNKINIYKSKVQDIDIEIILTLRSGDFLFIDSTHLMKTGSDVCYELFEILPKLKPGVFIHFHDIFWPFEYPVDWIFKDKRSWNEIYGIRAFLMYNNTFQIEFFNDYFVRNFPQLVKQDYPALLNSPGGSLWLRKIK
jgi:hypothetical protein